MKEPSETVPYIHKRALDILKRALKICKRALHYARTQCLSLLIKEPSQRALYIQNRALDFRKRALEIRERALHNITQHKHLITLAPNQCGFLSLFIKEPYQTAEKIHKRALDIRRRAQVFSRKALHTQSQKSIGFLYKKNRSLLLRRPAF